MGKKFYKKFKDKDFRVAIFGSARIKKNDETYKQIQYLGGLLGKRGIDIVTGGGPGLMEAANSGHKTGSKKTGAHSIGLNIKLPREQKTNKHLDIKEEFSKFSERLDKFAFLSDAVIVAQGGVGTMLEFFYTWQLVQVSHISRIPIILLGDMWKEFYEWLREQPLKRKYFDKRDLDLLYFAKDCKDAIAIIDKTYGDFKKKLN